MKNLIFNNCKSYEEIEAAILEALENDDLVDGDAAAERWFNDIGWEGDVCHRVIVSTHVSVWNEKLLGEEIYGVIVKEHFIDSGSVNYVYSYHIC